MKILRDDTVQIMLGKDRGKTGKVLRVLTKDSQLLIEGVNVYKRHVRRMGQQEGAILNINKPLNLSNVMLVCPNCKKPTRVGFKLDGNNKIRICRKCNQEIGKEKKGN